MIQLSTFLAFLIAGAILIVVPGPRVMAVVADSLRHGWQRATWTIAGEAAAHAGYILVVSLGLASVLLAFEGLFVTLKWVGVLTLVAFGLFQIVTAHATDEPTPNHTDGAPRRGWQMFTKGFIVTVTNPKALVFYGAFFVPFIEPATSLALQFALLGLTFLALFFVISTLYAILANVLAKQIRGSSRTRWFARISGGSLVGAGILLANVER